ncbi:MAG TPA: M13 family metallopeptidase [Myxococcaceae bacterium]|nr:M13 family metallopeptidase [Myxococcaceae bacterium]
MRPGLLLAALLGSAALAAGPAPGPAESPLPTLPYTPGLDPASMDRSVDPCVDFFAYSCGGWMAKNPIPPDQGAWSVFGKLEADIERHLWGLLQTAADSSAARSPIQEEIGDYFAACMDEARIESLGSSPLAPALEALAQVKDRKGLAEWVARQHLATRTGRLMFGFDAEQDASDATQYIAAVYAGGIGLPDRDDYLEQDAKAKEQRSKYQEHLVKTLQLLGDDGGSAKATARLVMDIETTLARATLTRVEQRDPYKLYHRLPREKLIAMAPTFDWKTYLATAGVPATKVLNVSQPSYFQALERELKRRPLADWKRYLRWHLVNVSARYLSRAFVDEDFAFHGKYLTGTEQMAPRWKRCVRWVDRDLGEALGQVFVAKNFSSELKERTLAMVLGIEHAMEEDLRTLEWMSPPTRARAVEKLAAMANKIGYPDRWRDYSSIRLARDDFHGNVTRAMQFEAARLLGRIGKPVDRGEWEMTPQTVNAYYSPSMNDMNFPAGVLQPPLYDPKMDAAPGYGNTGGTIGHELTHGFDDEGRQYDAKGNLKDWWTKQDADEFNRRSACVSDQYSSYIAVDDVHVNGKLTLGEDVADLGGAVLAYRAWRTATAAQRLAPVDGLTPDQRFFVGYAQWTCANVRPQIARLRARTDPHSPPRYRVNGLVVNMPEFGQAFSCKPGAPMTKPAEKVCRVW